MSQPQIPTVPAHSGAGSTTPGPASDLGEAKAGHHVVIFVIIIVIVIVRRLRRRLPREPIPLLPPTVPLQGVPSPHPLTSLSLFHVLLLLLLFCSDPPLGSVHHVLRDWWQGRLVTPQLLETDENLDCENQGQSDTRKKKERTLTRDMHLRSGRIKGWVRAPASSLPTVPATCLWRSSAERGTEDICEPSKSAPGIISKSSNRCSVKGSTLRRWMAATTPAALSPLSRSSCKASRRG
jgi:hypothetical protein